MSVILDNDAEQGHGDSEKFSSPLTQRVGRRVSFHRKNAKLTQKDFAAKMGLSQSLVAKMEAGAAPITLDRIEKIAQIFGMNEPEDMFRAVTI